MAMIPKVRAGQRYDAYRLTKTYGRGNWWDGRNDPTMLGEVSRMTLAGDKTPLAFRRTADALEVTLPAGARHPIGVALVLSGNEVTA